MFDAAMENVRWLADWGRQHHIPLAAPPASSAIRTVGVIGAGVMGGAIAAAHAKHRLSVVIHDVRPEALEAAAARAEAELGPKPLGRAVRTTAELGEAARCDLVLEAISETLAAKTRLYAQLREHLGPRTILASNTSAIPLRQLAQGLADPSRFCGLHFCHPVKERPLVEVVRGPLTGDATIAAALAHVRGIDRIPMVVRDGPGFVVNRLLFPYLGEALEMLREGVPSWRIERAAADFGMTVGPLRLIDEIGLDTTLQAAWVLAAEFPERIVSSPLLVSLVKSGRLGEKSGGGFFAHNEPGGTDSTELAPDAAETIAPWIESRRPCGADEATRRLILPMVLEATRILAEGKVSDVRDIDLAVLFGLGFPASRGGLLWWADSLGPRRIVAMLQSLAAMGPRAEPTPLLRAMAERDDRFYRLKLTSPAA